jgi:hypothetical protein
LHEARALLGFAVVNGKIYAIGGNNQSNGNIQCVDTNEEYDPATETWEPKVSMPTPRMGMQANVVDGKIYVIGGNSSANKVYNPATDSWTTKTAVPSAPALMWAWSCASVVVDNKINVMGPSHSRFLIKYMIQLQTVGVLVHQ